MELEENSNLLKNKRKSDEETIDKVNINAVEDEELRKLLIEQDRLERELFEKRIKQLDQDKKVRKVNMIENPLTAKLTINPDEKHLLGAQLRKLSRNAYLKMRTEQQLDLWRRRLADEKRMFEGVEMSEEEMILNDINNKIFDLANKRLAPKEEVEVYRMPDGFEDENGKIDYKKKNDVLHAAKYKADKKGEEKKHNENDEWQNSQTVKSLNKFGAQNHVKPSDKYQILIENQIDFVSKGILEGFEIEELKQKKSKFNFNF